MQQGSSTALNIPQWDTHAFLKRLSYQYYDLNMD